MVDDRSGPEAAAGMTIEELARQAACTTRNIRNYQTLGLLAPPVLVGRVGRYDQGHLARLRLIAQLQDHGFSLAGIGQLLQAWEEGKTLGDVLGFERALTDPWIDDEPALMDADELLRMFPEAAGDSSLVARAMDMGLIAIEGDAVRVDSPRLLAIGAELVRSGVPLAATLDELALLRHDLDQVAQRFVALFDEHVWRPFADAGMPADGLAAVTEALQRMRPLAAASVEVILAHAMHRRSAENTAVRAALGALDRPPSTDEPSPADPDPARATRSTAPGARK